MLEVSRTPSGNYAQPWTAYNAAQTHEKELFLNLLYELCQGIEEPERSTGRPRLPLRDMIFCMVFKVYSTFPSRRFMSDLREVQAKGLITVVPHFNSISNYMEVRAQKPILQQLIREGSSPLRAIENRFAIDSTGLGTPLRRRYYDRHKERFRVKRGWVKLHAMCGVQTNIITSAVVSDGEAGDSPFFQDLVRDTARYFEMSEVYADGAYTSNSNRRYALIWGADPYIAFRSNSVADGAPKSAIWKRMLQQFQDKESEFWRHYYNRNNIEATFSMMKRKFRDKLRTKSFSAQANEALCLVICHNLCVIIQSMYQLGIEPDFRADAEIRHPVNSTSEQELIKVRERIAALTVEQPSLWEFSESAREEMQANITKDKDALSRMPTPRKNKKRRKKRVDSKQMEMFS